jgi:hypothetical protein
MRIFISYSHIDKAAKEDLRRAPAPLNRVFPQTTVRYDGMIRAGQYWAKEIVAQLDGAKVVAPASPPPFQPSFL